jgi:AcrR family transcriptional regulator
LLEAALEVFTAQGFHGTKVRDVCRQSGLTERYLYESFGNKEALLAALAEEIVADLIAAVGPAIELAATDLTGAVEEVARAVVHSLTDDPRRAQILFVEVVGVSREMEDMRRQIIGGLTNLVRAGAARAYGDWVLGSIEVQLTSRGLIGAAQELLIAYARNELALDQETLITSFARLFMAAAPVMDAMPGNRSGNERNAL